MISLGLKYVASSVPVVCFTGVAIGVGIIFGSLIISIARNQTAQDQLIRWAFIGFSLVEVSGFIGLVYGFLVFFAY